MGLRSVTLPASSPCWLINQASQTGILSVTPFINHEWPSHKRVTTFWAILWGSPVLAVS